MRTFVRNKTAFIAEETLAVKRNELDHLTGQHFHGDKMKVRFLKWLIILNGLFHQMTEVIVFCIILLLLAYRTLTIILSRIYWWLVEVPYWIKVNFTGKLMF